MTTEVSCISNFCEFCGTNELGYELLVLFTRPMDTGTMIGASKYFMTPKKIFFKFFFNQFLFYYQKMVFLNLFFNIVRCGFIFDSGVLSRVIFIKFLLSLLFGRAVLVCWST